jgi:hypothetical protein
MRRMLTIALGVAGALITLIASPVAALTVSHETNSYTATIPWSCPGRDPIEQYTLTTRTTTFSVGDKRVRVMDHSQWRGWITNRETGELIRDDANWTNVYVFEGKHLVRAVQTGAVWRFTVPGHGIVVHQTGRSVFTPGEEDWASTFGGPADISTLCAYV